MIKFENVTKTFEGFAALDDFSLEIAKGSAYGLLGSNGAGKSTLLRMLAGIYRQDSGLITIEGEPVYDNVKIKQKTFYVSDNTSQYASMTLNEMKKFTGLFYPAFSEEIFQKLWEVIKLPMNKTLSAFSKGMKRQAAVICGIAACPEYLLLDEAFDGLDPTMRLIVKKMLVDAMLEQNMTIVISSHNLKEIEEFCDTVGLLHKGKTVFNRELDSIKGDIHKIQTSFGGMISREDIPEMDVMDWKQNGSVVSIIAKGECEALKQIILSKGGSFCDILPLSLEEIFIYEMEVLGYDYSEIDK